MKFLDKLGLALFSTLVLIIAIVVCLIALGWMEPTIFSILVSKALISQTSTYVVIGVCVVLMLLAIRCLFFSDLDKSEKRDDGILLQNEDGRLLITTDTLKDMVDGVVKEFAEVTDYTTNVIITRENDIVIEVEIDVRKHTIIKEVSSKLQTRVKKTVKETTDLDIKYVNVRVRNADTVLASSDEDEKVEAKPETKKVETTNKTVNKKVANTSKTVAKEKKEEPKSKTANK